MGIWNLLLLHLQILLAITVGVVSSAMIRNVIADLWTRARIRLHSTAVSGIRGRSRSHADVHSRELLPRNLVSEALLLLGLPGRPAAGHAGTFGCDTSSFPKSPPVAPPRCAVPSPCSRTVESTCHD